MPSATRLIRLATLPETRHVIVAASRSAEIRELARRIRSDRAGLIRELAHPATALGLVREAIAHPATRELANVGYVLLPGRYLPVGWAAAWLSRRVLGRSGDASRADASVEQPGASPKPVSPVQDGVPPR